MRLHLFFFFFFEFRPDLAISADTDQVGPIWATLTPISAASASISAASARFGNRHVARRSTDAQSAASLPRPAASDAGVLAWEPRPCILEKYTPLHRTDWDPGFFLFSKAKSLKFESHILLIQTFSTTTNNNSSFKSQQPATTGEVTLKHGGNTNPDFGIIHEERKKERPIPLSDWVPKIMKYFPKSENAPSCYITHTQKKKKKNEKRKRNSDNE